MHAVQWEAAKHISTALLLLLLPKTILLTIMPLARERGKNLEARLATAKLVGIYRILLGRLKSAIGESI